MTWGPNEASGFGLLQVRDSMSGADREGARRFVIDFALPGSTLSPDSETFTADVSCTRGRIADVVLMPHPDIQGLRLSFLFYPEQEDVSELRALLRQGDRPVSETWLFRWTEDDLSR
jgi:glucans biosynthesis protein